MNAKIPVFFVCVDAIINLLFYNTGFQIFGGHLFFSENISVSEQNFHAESKNNIDMFLSRLVFSALFTPIFNEKYIFSIEQNFFCTIPF